MKELLKTAKYLRDELYMESEEIRKVLESMGDDHDFEVGNYRFIHIDDIDEVQCEELGDDLYMLGYFKASFIANILGFDTDVIETLQKSEAFEGIGKMIISMDKLEELQQEYSSLDGYGHHFSHYDHSEREYGDYYIFRID